MLTLKISSQSTLAQTQIPLPEYSGRAIQSEDYNLDQCHKTFPGRSGLREHRQKHEGVKYGCDQCDYQATQRSDLNRHIQTVHEGVRYACVQCDYQATRQGNLALARGGQGWMGCGGWVGVWVTHRFQRQAWTWDLDSGLSIFH